MTIQIDDKDDIGNSKETTQVVVQDSASKATGKMKVRRMGYEDLKPTMNYPSSGPTEPTVENYRGPYNLPAFAGSGQDNATTFIYHPPHDLIVGQNWYIHPHWSVNAASPTGSVQWVATLCYARGYDLGDFDVDHIITLPLAPVVSQYKHHITESVAINADLIGEHIQPDGIIMLSLSRDTSDSSSDKAFLKECDIHYASDGTKTVERNETGSGFTKV